MHSYKLENKLEKLFVIIAIIILVIDFAYSTYQYQNTKLDGDFAGIVLPNEWYAKVLDDPFGKSAIIDGNRYQATNRFTSHFVMRTYFYNVPIFLQNFFNPIDSLYLSVTIAKILSHFLFVFLIAYYVTLILGYSKSKHVIAMSIIAPFLINFGLYDYFLGFNDKSITYSMFYTLPIVLMMAYYLPFFKRAYIHSQKISNLFLIIYIPISLLIVLSGPVVAPIMLLLNSTLFVYVVFKNNVYKTLKLSNDLLFYVIGILFSLYSIYLGTFNNENDICNLSISERYIALFKGLHNILFTIKEGVIFLYILIVINFFMIKKFNISLNFNKILLILLSIIILYIFLIPLGGCREYRPLILRRDTFLPILTIILFLISISSVHLLYNKRYLFLILWLPFSIVFWNSDVMPSDYESNNLEKKNLVQLSQSSDSCVLLNENFPVLSWYNTYNCNESYINSQLLLHYKITPRLILYKNK